MDLEEIKSYPKESGIYKITSPTGKVYIGQSKNIQKRLRYYLKDVPTSTKIGRSIKKYSIKSHIVEILELTENLDDRELYYITKYDSVINGLNTIYRNYTIEFSSNPHKQNRWSKERKSRHSNRIAELHKLGHYEDRKNIGLNFKDTMSVRDTRDGKVKRVTKIEYQNTGHYVGTCKGKKVPKRQKRILDTRDGTIYNGVIECRDSLCTYNTKIYNLIKKGILKYI